MEKVENMDQQINSHKKCKLHHQSCKKYLKSTWEIIKYSTLILLFVTIILTIYFYEEKPIGCGLGGFVFLFFFGPTKIENCQNNQKICDITNCNYCALDNKIHSQRIF